MTEKSETEKLSTDILFQEIEKMEQQTENISIL